MTIVAILVALAVLYWLGSLAYACLSNSAERSRLSKQPGLIIIALLAALSLVILLLGIYSPYGNLSILIGGQQLRIWMFGLIGCRFAVASMVTVTVGLPASALVEIKEKNRAVPRRADMTHRIVEGR